MLRRFIIAASAAVLWPTAWLAISVLPTSRASAASARILLAHDASESKSAARLRVELESIGLSVVEEEVPEGPAALAEAARKSGAVAAVRITPSSRGVEVWVVDRVTGKTLLREVVRGAAGDDDAVAVRAVELLRASLLELDAPTKPSGEVSAPPAMSALLPPKKPAPSIASSPPPGDVTLGIASTLSPGGINPIWQLQLGVRYRVAELFGVEVGSYLTPSSTNLASASASADVSVFAFTFGGEVSTPPARDFAASFGAGFAFLWLRANAHDVSSGLVGHSISWTAPTWYVRGGGAYRLATRVRLRADVLLGAPTSQLVLTVGNTDVARWGRPFVTPSLSLELGWP